MWKSGGRYACTLLSSSFASHRAYTYTMPHARTSEILNSTRGFRSARPWDGCQLDGDVPERSGASPPDVESFSDMRTAGPGSETAPASGARRAGRDEAVAAPASPRAGGRAA